MMTLTKHQSTAENSPTISVVMGAYNAEKSIKVAIQSILNQTFVDFEFIIINDGSTDKTGDIVNSFDDRRIVYINKKENEGLSSALNHGIKIARGLYIARMDADDESLPERFSLQMDFLRKNPDIDVLGAAMFYQNEKICEIAKAPLTHSQCIDNLVRGVCCYHPTVMLKRNIFNDISYSEKYRASEDYKLWIDLAQRGKKFANLSIPLLRHHIHDENISVTMQEQQQYNANLIRKEFIKYYLNIDNEKYDKEISWLSGCLKQEISLKILSDFYRELYDKRSASRINFLMKRKIKDRITLLTHQLSFEKISFRLLVYYLRYKLKNLCLKK